MLWQYLITGAIILSAILLTVQRLWNYFSNPLHKCDGCTSDSGGCALEDLKKEIQSGKKMIQDTG